MADSSSGPSGTTSPSVDTLIEFIHGVVADYFSSSGRAMNGAQLGYLIRQQFPSTSYADFGLTKLGDAVRLAESRGLVKRSQTVEHLEVFPAEVQRQQPRAVVPARPHINPEVWRALFFLGPRQTAFFCRSTNEVQILEGEPDSATSDELVKIPRVKTSEQATWLQEFLSSKGRDGEFPTPQLPLIIPNGKQLGSSDAKEWRRFRGDKAAALVSSWAIENEVPMAAVLEEAAPQKRPAHSHSSESQEDPRARSAVLAILNDMSLEELESTLVPVRLVLRHFRPK